MDISAIEEFCNFIIKKEEFKNYSDIPNGYEEFNENLIVTPSTTPLEPAQDRYTAVKNVEKLRNLDVKVGDKYKTLGYYTENDGGAGRYDIIEKDSNICSVTIDVKQKNIKRYLPHEIKTREKAVKMYRNCNDIGYVCRKYHISRTSLWRWNKKYDGSKESLEDKSHRPLSNHPKEHTETKIKWIKDLIKRNPHITLNEIWYKLKINKGYTRKPASLYRVLRKIGYYNNPEIKGTSKKHNKKYHTPTEIGKKWQIDVKYVPKECKIEGMTKDINYYQYTCIDEASRERYLYWYEEHSAEYTVDFVKRCIRYYGYKTEEIQTDNGVEFTFNRSDVKREHPMDTLLNELGIKRHKIRPRTPEHNGKVERSHRNDNERFYSYLKFYSLEDLRKQGAAYLKRSNRIPMAVLGYLTPKEKRKN